MIHRTHQNNRLSVLHIEVPYNGSKILLHYPVADYTLIPISNEARLKFSFCPFVALLSACAKTEFTLISVDSTRELRHQSYIRGDLIAWRDHAPHGCYWNNVLDIPQVNIKIDVCALDKEDKTKRESSLKCLIKCNKLSCEMIQFRLTLNINHGITCTVKGFIHSWRTTALWVAGKNGIKVNFYLSINLLKLFYFSSFLPTCLILRGEFKTQLWIIPFINWQCMIPKAWGCLFVAFSHPQMAWHTYVFFTKYAPLLCTLDL